VSARVRRRRALAVLLVLLVAVGVWVGAAGRGGSADAGAPAAARSASAAPVAAAAALPDTPSASVPADAPGSVPASSSVPPGPDAVAGSLAQVAGLGRATSATVPASSTQAVVVRGDAVDVSLATVELYERDARGWRRTGAWRGHVGARGWTQDHHEGDLRTPVGTFTLSDAGGRLPDPGTLLPYHQSTDFVPSTDRAFGDSLAGAFDYVVAIDFNRVAGRSPLDSQRPKGPEVGGGIWLHVDHDGPTHGCVSLPEDGIRTLLRALLPAAHPVVVMGDVDRLRA
jgi:L,D-peptidoglycan transpeptidase YkuD (ErfK/YbiS/YcfS/YnhG family)